MPDDEDVRGRNDFVPPSAPRVTTLPPEAKMAREIGYIIRDIALSLMTLLAAKWGLVDGYVFAVLIGGFLGGNFALRKSESALDIVSRR